MLVLLLGVSCASLAIVWCCWLSASGLLLLLLLIKLLNLVLLQLVVLHDVLGTVIQRAQLLLSAGCCEWGHWASGVPESCVALLTPAAVLIQPCCCFGSLQVFSVLFWWVVGLQMLPVAQAAGLWRLLLLVLAQCWLALQAWGA